MLLVPGIGALLPACARESRKFRPRTPRKHSLGPPYPPPGQAASGAPNGRARTDSCTTGRASCLAVIATASCQAMSRWHCTPRCSSHRCIWVNLVGGALRRPLLCMRKPPRLKNAAQLFCPAILSAGGGANQDVGEKALGLLSTSV